MQSGDARGQTTTDGVFRWGKVRHNFVPGGLSDDTPLQL